MGRTTFKIPSVNMACLDERLAKLNKVAKKLGKPEITTRITGMIRDKYKGSMRTWYCLELEGEVLKLDGGWTFLGTLEHTPAGNILRSVPDAEIDAKYRSAGPNCDHCGLDRRRKDTYLVRAENGDVKQVGHNCVADYLGHANPAYIALCAELVSELSGLGSEDFEGGGSGKQSLTPEEYLAEAAAVIRTKGYASRAACQRSLGLQATAGVAWRNAFPSREAVRDGLVIPVLAQDEKLAREALEWAKNLEGVNDYEHNLKITSQLPVILEKHAGLLASAVAGYQRHLGKLELQKSRARLWAEKCETSAYLGEIGKREVFTLTVKNAQKFESNFSREGTCLYTLEDAAGRAAAWWSAPGQLEVGKTYRLKATVKKQAEYKGLKQTTLSRCTDEDQAEKQRAENKAAKAKLKALKKEAPTHDWQLGYNFSLYCRRCSCTDADKANNCKELQPGVNA